MQNSEGTSWKKWYRTPWHIGSALAVVGGLLSSAFLVSIAGGGIDSAVSGVGYWVILPYIAFSLPIYLANDLVTGRIAFVGAAILSALGIGVYLDAAMFSSDGQSGLAFFFFPLVQIAITIACMIAIAIMRTRSAIGK